jgi:hypothetical protein
MFPGSTDNKKSHEIVIHNREKFGWCRGLTMAERKNTKNAKGNGNIKQIAIPSIRFRKCNGGNLHIGM